MVVWGTEVVSRALDEYGEEKSGRLTARDEENREGGYKKRKKTVR